MYWHTCNYALCKLMKYCGAIVNADGLSTECENDITGEYQPGNLEDSVSLTPLQVNERDSDIAQSPSL